jgi:preprotein translocase subunit SecD
MNSDYIPRLRAELLRAGASAQPTRAARAARGLRPLAVAAAVALLAVAVVLALPAGEGDEAPVTREQATLTYRVAPADAEAAARVMRERLAGMPGVRVTTAGGTLSITAPADARETVDALTQPGRFAVYDWEPNVIGELVAVSLDEARSRAAARPGSAVLRAPEGWYALAGEPALTTADVARAIPATDPRIGEPIVAISLTARGRSAWEALTGEVARRGKARSKLQHLAITLDGRIYAVAYIDPRDAPNGIDGRRGMQISGLRSADEARRIATLLSAGPLDAKLVPTR